MEDVRTGDAAEPAESPRSAGSLGAIDPLWPLGRVELLEEPPAGAGSSCVESVALLPIERTEAERLAKVFKAVAEPTRLQLLSMIQVSPGGEACVCDLTSPLGLTQPTISHHLKVLVDAGLLTRSKRGTWAWYAIVPTRLHAIRALLR